MGPALTEIGKKAFDGWESGWDGVFTIQGYDGTYAEAWAKENEYSFESLGAAPDTAGLFKDVPKGAYYAEAADWAFRHGITTGTSADQFSPNLTCTRGQIVTFLYRDLAGAKPQSILAETPLTRAQSYWIRTEEPPVCGRDDWAVFDLMRNAVQSGTIQLKNYQAYYASAEELAKQTHGKMNAGTAPELARIVLAVTVLGYNAADVAGYDLTAELNRSERVCAEGAESAAWALLALDSGDYVSYARPDYVKALLDALATEDTALPLLSLAAQALSPYADQPDVASALRTAANRLSQLLGDDAGLSAGPEIIAQALIAEQAISTAPCAHNVVFIVTPLARLEESLLAYQGTDGGFSPTQGGTAEAAASELGLRALTAMQCRELGVLLCGIR